MEKDIPFLQRVLPKKFTAAYMKGRNNYVCLQRLNRAQSSPVLDGLDEGDYFEDVTHWSRESLTGDRAELANLPEHLSFWRHIDARSETCIGQKCPDFDPASLPGCEIGLRMRTLSWSIIICFCRPGAQKQRLWQCVARLFRSYS